MAKAVYFRHTKTLDGRHTFVTVPIYIQSVDFLLSVDDRLLKITVNIQWESCRDDAIPWFPDFSEDHFVFHLTRKEYDDARVVESLFGLARRLIQDLYVDLEVH